MFIRDLLCKECLIWLFNFIFDLNFLLVKVIWDIKNNVVIVIIKNFIRCFMFY